jgi:ribosomal protein L40E
VLKCTYCGSEQNPPDAKRCKQCGIYLATEAIRQSGEHKIVTNQPDPSLEDTNPDIDVEEDPTIDSTPTHPSRDVILATQPEIKLAEDLAHVAPLETSCPYCGQPLPHDLTLKARNCETCGTRLVPDARFCHKCGTEQPIIAPLLHFILLNEQKHDLGVHIKIDDAERSWTVGRTIEQLNHFVAIDLTPHGAKERGVSRSHAEIKFDVDSGHWLLSDLGSQFGTFINDEKLTPQQPVPLADGQVVRFGGVEFRVTLES